MLFATLLIVFASGFAFAFAFGFGFVGCSRNVDRTQLPKNDSRERNKLTATIRQANNPLLRDSIVIRDTTVLRRERTACRIRSSLVFSSFLLTHCCQWRERGLSACAFFSQRATDPSLPTVQPTNQPISLTNHNHYTHNLKRSTDRREKGPNQQAQLRRHIQQWETRAAAVSPSSPPNQRRWGLMTCPTSSHSELVATGEQKSLSRRVSGSVSGQNAYPFVWLRNCVGSGWC